MAVHFDFTVSNADAENLHQCISTQLSHSHEGLQEAMMANDLVKVECYKKDIKYLNELRTKMHCTWEADK